MDYVAEGLAYGNSVYWIRFGEEFAEKVNFIFDIRKMPVKTIFSHTVGNSLFLIKFSPFWFISEI